ncbi:hypothetical protein [Crossiella sp. CA198]|uniref:hypothetical protein n=1 Tax=Crossiella sp. CA198 TaxID=3455607 RepID=UPI003F8D5C72
MLYLGNASSPRIREAMAAGELGQMCTPAEGRTPLPGVTWAADNGCFGRGYPGDGRWLRWLDRHADAAERCLFATAPDVVGDAAATLARSTPWFEPIRERGYRVALVAQDGLTAADVPWSAVDVLFVGGSTEWKLGDQAVRLAAETVDRGLTVHMGRVNSGRRWRYATGLGCDSADGTFLAFAPDANLARLRAWMV